MTLKNLLTRWSAKRARQSTDANARGLPQGREANSCRWREESPAVVASGEEAFNAEQSVD